MEEETSGFVSRYRATILVSFVSGVMGTLFVLMMVGAFLWITGSLNSSSELANNEAERINSNTSHKQNPPKNSTPLPNSVSRDDTIIEIVDRVSPAVVSVVITKDVPVIGEYYRDFDPFQQFFGGQSPFGGFSTPSPQGGSTERRQVGGGSGFIVSPDGLIVTNKHVVSDRTATYSVLLSDGSTEDAEVLARDSVVDIAILKIQKTGLAYVSFADSDVIRTGETAIAIGNALAEFQNSVSVGIISGLSRSIVAGDGMGKTELLDDVIQTDAAINPGNSGGPLLNLSGKVIGVNVAQAQGSENIGFAIPSNIVANIVSSVKEHGRIVRPSIGVRYLSINKFIQSQNALPTNYGVLVIRGTEPSEIAVVPDSPADKAGIIENDIVLEVDGKRLDEKNTLASVIRKQKVGDSLTLTILRNGLEKKVKVELVEAP